MTLSGYFMSKSVFGQQGCRALTFALARLSCFWCQAKPVPYLHDTRTRNQCQKNGVTMAWQQFLQRVSCA